MIRLALAALLVTSAARADRLEGVALPLYHGEHDFLTAVDEIAGLGASHISLPVFWRQTDVRANAVLADPAVTIDDQRLRAVIRRAHQRGLVVLLFPIIELDVVKRGEWRGTLAPRDPAAWWASYERFVVHYATIAAEEKVAMLSVGSELGATEGWQERWWHLLGRVERIFPGALLYSANWDHYPSVTFWDRLDYVGVSAYFGVSQRADASEVELAAAWRKELARLAGFARARKKPIVLTEVGLPSRDGAAIAPWDYTRGTALDLEEQRRGYVAFFAAWGDTPGIDGAFLWHWFGAGGLGDGGYSPRGKPAEQVVRRGYGGIGGPVRTQMTGGRR